MIQLCREREKKTLFLLSNAIKQKRSFGKSCGPLLRGTDKTRIIRNFDL